MTTKEKLGQRLQCSQCQIKFYDLNRHNPVCPKCGGEPSVRCRISVKPEKPVEIENDEVDLASDDIEIIPLDGLEEEFAEL